MPESLTILPTATHARVPWLERVLGHCDRQMIRFLDGDTSSVLTFLEENDVPDDPFPVRGYPATITPTDAVGVILASAWAWWTPIRRVNTVKAWLAKNHKEKLLAEFKEQVPRIMAAAPGCTSIPPCPSAHEMPRHPLSPVDTALRNLDSWVTGMASCYCVEITGLSGPTLVPVHELLRSLRRHILRHTTHHDNPPPP